MTAPAAATASASLPRAKAAESTADAASLLYGRLAHHAAGHANDHALACMIASLCDGSGALPDWLGLEPPAFHCLMRYHFPGLELGDQTRVGRPLDHQRGDERVELVELMLLDKAGDSPSEVWIAHIVAAACMASDHLWQDLGLWQRADLSELMRRNFPSLAARNVKDMKWKKFLYKQLCEAEGIYACRAPSCEVCVDYQVCFGPEG